MTIKKDAPAATVTAPSTGAAPGDKMCASCGKETASYCKACYDDNAEPDDDDDDEEEAKALGLEPKASRSERIKHMSALATFARETVAATGAESMKTAAEKITEGAKALGDVASMRADANRRELRLVLERGLNDKRLTLGAIKSKAGVALRGEPKAAWSKAMTDLKTVSKQTVLDAACSIDVGAENLAAVTEWVATQEPTSTETFVEPERDPEGESVSLDETNQKIDAAVKKTKAALDRGKPANTKK